MHEAREITLRVAKTEHDGITDPIRIKPATMSRREWRGLIGKAKRAMKKQEVQKRREEAAMPESVKLDRRMHAAGLVSPRDARQLIPVRLDRVLEGV